MSKLSKILGKPRTIEHPIPNRKISWLELFYDLMFAVVFARLTEGQMEHLTVKGVILTVLMFAWFLWGWGETSGYFDNHGNDSLLNILIVNAEMVLTGIGAIFIPEAIAGYFGRVIIVLTLIELLMAVVWMSLAHFDPTHGPASLRWGLGHLVTTVLLFVAWPLHAGGQLTILVIGLLANILNVFVANRQLRREYDAQDMQHQIKDSLVERYGLMTMIALGEVIAGLFDAMQAPITGLEIGRFIVCLLITALAAAIYYQVLGEVEIIMKSSIGTSLMGWVFMLVILFAFMMGVGMQVTALHPQALFAKLALAIALITFLWGVRVIYLVGTQPQKRVNNRLIRILLIVESLVILALLPLSGMNMMVGDLVIFLLIILQGSLMHA